MVSSGTTARKGQRSRQLFFLMKVQAHLAMAINPPERSLGGIGAASCAASCAASSERGELGEARRDLVPRGLVVGRHVHDAAAPVGAEHPPREVSPLGRVVACAHIPRRATGGETSSAGVVASRGYSSKVVYTQ